MLSMLLFILAWLAFLFGTFISIANFYWGWLRWPIYRWRKLPKDDYRNISGIPLLGSLLLGLSWLGLQSVPVISDVVLILLVLDPVGIFWALIVFISMPFLALFYRR
jgi:hypothetical protein